MLGAFNKNNTTFLFEKINFSAKKKGKITVFRGFVL